MEELSRTELHVAMPEFYKKKKKYIFTFQYIRMGIVACNINYLYE